MPYLFLLLSHFLKHITINTIRYNKGIKDNTDKKIANNTSNTRGKLFKIESISTNKILKMVIRIVNTHKMSARIPHIQQSWNLFAKRKFDNK